MSTLKSRLKYLLRSLQKRATGFISRCPNCGSTIGPVIDAKFAVTQLVECADCYLLYRTPTDTEQENDRFYQSEYEQGATTEMPNEQALSRLLKEDFTSVSKNHTPYLNLFESLNLISGTRVLDYGCSWGYGTYQFQKAGMVIDGL